MKKLIYLITMFTVREYLFYVGYLYLDQDLPKMRQCSGNPSIPIVGYRNPGLNIYKYAATLNITQIFGITFHQNPNIIPFGGDLTLRRGKISSMQVCNSHVINYSFRSLHGSEAIESREHV